MHCFRDGWVPACLSRPHLLEDHGKEIQRGYKGVKTVIIFPPKVQSTCKEDIKVSSMAHPWGSGNAI